MTRHKEQASSWLHCTAGNATVIFSVAAAVLLGCAGAAIDYARAHLEHTAIQTHLDAAVLAGVSGTLLGDKQIAVAQEYFALYAEKYDLDYESSFTIDGGKLIGTVTGRMPTTLLRALDINSLVLDASSAAVSREYLEPLCIMAMHPTRAHTLEMHDAVDIVAPNCNIYGNSNHEFDVVDLHDSENRMEARFVAAIGGGHNFLENVSPSVEFGTRLVADPLAQLGLPAAGDCTATSLVLDNVSQSLAPGHYCGGLTIKNGAQITLAAGDYYISNGAFSLSNAQLTGEDVTIFLMDNKARLRWTDSVVRLAAQKTGAHAGIAVFGARVDTDNTLDQSVVDIHGVLYMPKGAFEWTNAGDATPTAKWSAFVTDGFSWKGTGAIRINFKPEDSDIPYPEELVAMPRPTDPRLVN